MQRAESYSVHDARAPRSGDRYLDIFIERRHLSDSKINPSPAG